MKAIITGASKGLGAEIALALRLQKRKDDAWTVIDWSKEKGIDVSNSMSISNAKSHLKQILWLDKLDLLINCAGINRINYLSNVSKDEYDLVMDTNAKGIFLCTKFLLDHLKGGTIINIVSNAAHVPMTSSLAYNASKAAALMMTKQMARELKKTHDITVFSVSPNKMFGTGMSKEIDQRVCELRGWTPEEAKAYQLAALPAGEETDPKCVAEFIAFLVSSKERHKYLNGCDIPYGA